MASNRDFQLLSAVLSTQGPAAALALLNEGVPHRYSAAYRVEGGILLNVLRHDKQGEVRPDFLAAVPFESSFCQFVLRDGTFRTSNSGTDARLNGHPYQGVMVSYHGVPLIDNSGELIGTLCHFDVDQLELSDEEFGLLQKAGRAFPPFLPPSQ